MQGVAGGRDRATANGHWTSKLTGTTKGQSAAAFL